MATYEFKAPERQQRSGLDDFLKLLQVGKSIQSLLAPSSGQTISATSLRNNILNEVDSYFQDITYDSRFFTPQGNSLAYNSSIAGDEASQFFNPVIEQYPQLTGDILRRIKINSRGLPKQFKAEKLAFSSAIGIAKGDIDREIKSINWNEEFLSDNKYNSDILVDKIKKNELVGELYNNSGQYKPELDRYIKSKAKSMPHEVWIPRIKSQIDFFNRQVKSYDKALSDIANEKDNMVASGRKGEPLYQTLLDKEAQIIMSKHAPKTTLNNLLDDYALLTGLEEFKSQEDILGSLFTKPSLSEKQRFILENQQ